MDDSIKKLHARINDLETQIAFQDDLLENLSQVAAKQDADLLELKRQIKSIRQRVLDSDEASDSRLSQSEVPPHY